VDASSPFFWRMAADLQASLSFPFSLAGFMTNSPSRRENTSPPLFSPLLKNKLSIAASLGVRRQLGSHESISLPFLIQKKAGLFLLLRGRERRCPGISVLSLLSPSRSNELSPRLYRLFFPFVAGEMEAKHPLLYHLKPHVRKSPRVPPSPRVEDRLTVQERVQGLFPPPPGTHTICEVLPPVYSP